MGSAQRAPSSGTESFYSRHRAGCRTTLPFPCREGGRRELVSHSGLITVMTPRGAQAAPRVRRLRRGRAAPGEPQGPADFVSLADERAEQTVVEELRHARPDWGSFSRRPARSRAIRPSRAGSSTRSTARRTSSTASPFRHLDRGPGAEARRRLGRDQPRPGLPAADRRELLGRRGRAPGGPAAARVVASRPVRGADRDRHSLQGPRRSRPLRKDPRRRGAGGRDPALRLRRARPRLGRRRPLRRLLGRGSGILGHRRRTAAGPRGGAASSPISAAPTPASPRARCSPATTRSIPGCTSWSRARCADPFRQMQGGVASLSPRSRSRAT